MSLLKLITTTNRNSVRNTLTNAHIAVAGDVNPVISYINDTFTPTTVTQDTSITTGVTINSKSGVITTVALTTAAGAAESPFTVTNSTVTSSSVVLVSVEYANGKTGFPVVAVEAVSNGSFALKVLNGKASGALNDVIKIHFLVVNV